MFDFTSSVMLGLSVVLTAVGVMGSNPLLAIVGFIFLLAVLVNGIGDIHDDNGRG